MNEKENTDLSKIKVICTKSEQESPRYKLQKEELDTILYSLFYSDSNTLPIRPLLVIIREYAMDCYTDMTEITGMKTIVVLNVLDVNRLESILVTAWTVFHMVGNRIDKVLFQEPKFNFVAGYDARHGILVVCKRDCLLKIDCHGTVLNQTPLQLTAPNDNTTLQFFSYDGPKLTHDGSTMYILYAHVDKTSGEMYNKGVYEIDTTTGLGGMVSFNDNPHHTKGHELVSLALLSTPHSTMMMCLQYNHCFCFFTGTLFKRSMRFTMHTDADVFQRCRTEAVVWTPSGHVIVAMREGESDYVRLYYRDQGCKMWTLLNGNENMMPSTKEKYTESRAVGHVLREAQFQNLMSMTILVAEQALMLVLFDSMLVKFPLPAFFFLVK